MLGIGMQDGILMLQYSGHGDYDRWSRKSIWNTTDVYGLQNGALLPLVMTFNCKDGYFAIVAIMGKNKVMWEPFAQWMKEGKLPTTVAQLDIPALTLGRQRADRYRQEEDHYGA